MLRYISSKHSKFGMKFLGFCGERHRLHHQDDVLFRQKISASNIRFLSRNNSGHACFCDSFFTSIELAKILRNHRTFLTGTIMSNRRLPAMIKDAIVDSGTTSCDRVIIFLLPIRDITVDVMSVYYPLRFLPTLLKVCFKLSEHTTAAWVESMVQICNYLFTATQENH